MLIHEIVLLLIRVSSCDMGRAFTWSILGVGV